jgi:hypothetical protein
MVAESGILLPRRRDIVSIALVMNNQLASALQNEIGILASFVDIGEGWRVSGSWGKGNTGVARWWG